MFKLPKYSLHFFLFIIVSKVVYLLVEWYYNVHLINTITTAQLTKEMLTSIESLGHNVSSVGLTLLLVPFFYLLIRLLFPKIQQIAMGIVVFLFMVGAYFSFHHLLTSYMDEIVKDNKDKRYTSYYISSFKYGMLNGHMGYETFIPKERLAAPTVDDRVMLSNMFLLNYIDENLTNRVIDSATDNFVDIFIDQYGQKEYEEAKTTFESKADEIADAYNRYITESNNFNTSFAKADNPDVINAEYEGMINNLYSKYDRYETAVIQYENSRDLSDAELSSHYKDLAKYFRYQTYDKAKRKYKNKMNNLFGYYIKPKRWCEGNVCPTKQAIEKVVAQESYKKWKKKMGRIPPNLGQRQFFNHPSVKSKVVKALHKKGLYVSKKFNYSKKSFYRAYQNKVNREFKKGKKKFLKTFSNELGKRVTFGMSYEKFVAMFKSDIYKKYGKKYGKRLYLLLKKQDTEGFYEQFYRPYFKENFLNGYILSKEELDTPEHSEVADNAIKHLYIPPFAIGMSLFAGILNLISLIGLTLFYFVKMEHMSSVKQLLIKGTTKLLIFGLVFSYPFIVMKEKNVFAPYKAIEMVKKDSQGSTYLKALEWVMIYERMIYIESKK